MIELKETEQWNGLLEKSKDVPVVILKHSLICPISARAFQKIDEAEKKGQLPSDLYLLIVQRQEDLSDKIARDLSVQHESPQVIVIKDQKAVDHVSHFNITAAWLVSVLKQLK
jgi:bacillithiol system protein YtxJ